MPEEFSRGDSFRPYGKPEVQRAIRACQWLSDRAKLVWAALVDHAGENGECFPSNKTIGSDIGGINKRSVQRYLDELETAGLIKRVPRLDPAGDQTSNLVEFTWLPIDELRKKLTATGVMALVTPPHGATDTTPWRYRHQGDGAGDTRGDGAGVTLTKSILTKPLERTPNPSEEDAGVRAQVRNGTSQESSVHRFGHSMGEPSDIWSAAGWDGPEAFEPWWAELVRRHPNRNRNGTARTKVIELIQAGQFRREEFEAGYEALADAHRDRWAEEGGRYAPNLFAILDDGLWRFTPERTTYVDTYTRG